MSKARNMVIAGDFEGKLVGRCGQDAYIILKITNLLYLDREHVQRVELIDVDSDVSLASATVRSFVGEMMFGAPGMLGAVTAKRNSRFVLGIIFTDGKRSAIEVDEKICQIIVNKFGSKN